MYFLKIKCLFLILYYKRSVTILCMRGGSSLHCYVTLFHPFLPPLHFNLFIFQLSIFEQKLIITEAKSHLFHLIVHEFSSEVFILLNISIDSNSVSSLGRLTCVRQQMTTPDQHKITLSDLLLIDIIYCRLIILRVGTDRFRKLLLLLHA